MPDRLQGVDLRLDNFDLSEAKRVSPEAQEGSWIGELQSLDECVAVGDSFWKSLDADSKIFKDDDKTLLREVFQPRLSDRRAEGDLFAPPDASSTYVTKLRGLVKEEESVRQRRRAHFLSKAFDLDEPGTLFPFLWKSSFESSSRTKQRPHGALVARPEYKLQAAELLQAALQDSSPVFEKYTEEGICFRIYYMGNLEVRTIQEVDGEEVVGAVFSIQTPTGENAASEVRDHKKLVKVTQYVERSLSQAHYYVVLETEDGQKICMERLASGKVAWEAEPADLEARNSLAKVMNAGECRHGLLVGDMKAYQSGLAGATSAASHAQQLFARATAGEQENQRQESTYTPSVLMSNFMANQTNSKKIAFKKK
jgi:hypothetical protein